MDEARELFKSVLALDAGNARAFYMLSGVAVRDREIGSAIGLLRRAIELEPTNAKFHFSLGSIFGGHNEPLEAIESYQRAVSLEPDEPEWRHALGTTLMAAGRIDEAIEALEAVLHIQTQDARTWFDLGNALQRRNELRRAEEAFQRATELAPDAGEAFVNLSRARYDQARPVEAEAPAREAITLAPQLPDAWFALATSLMRQGRHTEAVDSFRKVVELQPAHSGAWSGLFFCMNYSDRYTPQEIFEAHLGWSRASQLQESRHLPVDPAVLTGKRRIRVGYLSPDYYRHPISYFIEAVLRHHDRARFEVFCYHTGERCDEVTEQLMTQVEHWEPVHGLSDDELEAQLRADHLDIIVELTGHNGGHKLSVLARRVAPVQVTYLGYPNTTGVRAIDYRVTDAVSDPPGVADELYVEQLVRLPETFLCYTPPVDGPVPRDAPHERNGFVTFGSFNNFSKISAATLEAWGRILECSPQSRLFVKTIGLQDPGLRDLMLRRFAERGISGERIVLAPMTRSHLDHFAAYSEVDIALDTFPYNGTTTTLDALWMGVPVVALDGNRHAAKVGHSILSALGLSELVAASPESYVEIAVALAANSQRLTELRRTLRERLMGSVLTDGKRFTAHLEQALMQMLQEKS
jgi:predicted O-linked N-acetylglucosamine transferase (SPINDLY family)